MDGNACADQLCRDLRLEIGEGEDEVRLERADLRDIGRGEGPPSRIVCLTEETVETLYLLGEQDRIVGVSGYAVRPQCITAPRLNTALAVSCSYFMVQARAPIERSSWLHRQHWKKKAPAEGIGRRFKPANGVLIS